MKYVKPDGRVLEIHERSVEYVERLGWKPYVVPEIITEQAPPEVEAAIEKAAPRKKVAKKKAAKKKAPAKKKNKRERVVEWLLRRK